MSDDTELAAQIEAMTPDEAREAWDKQSRVLARSIMARLSALVANGLSYEVQKALYDTACAAFIMTALDLKDLSEIPPGMTVEKAAQNLTPERYGAAIRRQAEEAANANPLQLMIMFANLMEMNDDLFIVIENFAAEAYRRKNESDKANEITKILKTLFPLHPTPQ